MEIDDSVVVVSSKARLRHQVSLLSVLAPPGMRCSLTSVLLATASGYSPSPTSTVLNEANADQVSAETAVQTALPSINVAPFIYKTTHTESKYGTPCENAVQMECDACMVECADGTESCYSDITGPSQENVCSVEIVGPVRVRITNRDFTYGELRLSLSRAPWFSRECALSDSRPVS